MKHTHRLLALALTLATTGAIAQSSVQLYGRVNTTLEQRKTGGIKVTGLYNTSSRFGFRGTEDLGGGMSAGFNLESGFSSDTGASDPSGMFARRSEVNLSGGFGTVRLGRWFAESYFATADYVSMHNHDTGSSSDALYAYVMRDTNKIAYRTPNLGGLTMEGAVSLHEQASGAGGKNAYDLALNYEAGALALGAGYTKLDTANQFALRALYTTGPFSVGGYVQRDKNGIVAGGGNRTNARLAVAYTMGASELHFNVGRAGKMENVADSAATQATLGYNYNLSKRTKVYGFYTRVNNNSGASYNAGAAGADFSSLAVGVRHNF